MKRRHHIAAGLALLGLSSAASAQGQICLTQQETAALVGYALPDLLSGLREKCKATLPPAAFLRTRAAEVETRYRTEADALWPQAKAAFIKMMGDDDMVRKMPDAAVRPFLTAAFATAVVDGFKPGDCAMADGIAEALAPLPAANLARVMGLIIAADGKSSDAAGKSGFNICG
jgi:hypothetical protein